MRTIGARAALTLCAGWASAVLVAAATLIGLSLLVVTDLTAAAEADALTFRNYGFTVVLVGTVTALPIGIFLAVTRAFDITSLPVHLAFGAATPVIVAIGIGARRFEALAELPFVVPTIGAGCAGALAYWLVAVRPQIASRRRQPG